MRDERAREAIDRRREAWITAINRGDPDGFVAVVAEDAVWVPWGRDAIRGRDRIHDWLQEPFARFTYDYEVADVRLRVAGVWAVERAHFRTRATGPGGEEAPIHEGEYTILWHYTSSDGWLIDRYIDHSGDGSA